MIVVIVAMAVTMTGCSFFLLPFFRHLLAFFAILYPLLPFFVRVVPVMVCVMGWMG